MSAYLVLEYSDYKDKKNLIKKFETAYGNEHIFKFAMIKLLNEFEREATAFGLFCGYQSEPLTLKKIGERMNLSTSRIGVLSYTAFRRLIHPGFRKKVWKEYGYK